MRSFQKHLEEFSARGVRVAVVSVDPPAVTRERCRKEGLTFACLSDPQAETVRRYDLLHAGAGPEGNDIARPAEFLIDSSGVVRWAHLTGSIVVRARPEAAVEAIDQARLGPASASSR